MKLAVLMDPLDSIKPYKDSTVAMLQSAQQLGWECSYFTTADMACRQGQAFAQVTPLTLGDEKSNRWVEVGETEEKSLNEFNIILMRKDPPFDMEYIYATYALELAEKAGVLVANKPQSLRDANEKFFTLQFPQCCPLTLATKNIDRLYQFWKQHQQVVYKPLEGMGGNAIFHVDENANNLSVILEVLTQNETVTIMAQRYIPEIKNLGDKRILLIDGFPVPYALARIPAKGDIRGNLAAGARGEVVAITDRDRWICEQIAPTLREKGLFFVGIDVIGDYLTEINVTSPTCIREIMQVTGLDIAGDYMRSLAEKLST
ncbi:glutathione synthetase [Legionella birminghamensis]|uniref:Glutathione synthetase n=1 Tax=Legionella birminghamensis TaxID=28083 RepID=A0A378IBK5_9GAMM|nr:glutathione synthase [Legionella birminghamensis]KTC71615.1 glutathione synthetase [Legionella birminghamensis]STX32549.1 glutathione synthetase [Legionella birminghamensis]